MGVANPTYGKKLYAMRLRNNDLIITMSLVSMFKLSVVEDWEQKYRNKDLTLPLLSMRCRGLGGKTLK